MTNSIFIFTSHSSAQEHIDWCGADLAGARCILTGRGWIIVTLEGAILRQNGELL